MKLLLTLLATASLAAAATGDVSVVGRSDAWSCDVYVEGFTTGASINTGRSGTYKTTTASTPYFTVTSVKPTTAGGTTTTTRIVYIDDAIRKAHPDQAQRDEDTSTVPGSLRIRFGLSKPFYSKDDTGAGNSGTSITFTAPAGFIVNTGGAGQSSNACTATAITNDSTLAYPDPVGHWDWRTVLPFTRKTDTFTVSYRATHAFGIQAVKLDATGVSSGATVSSTVTAVSKIGPTPDGQYYDAYTMSVPLTSFTQGEQIRLRSRVYPNVGDTTEVIDTETFTAIRADGLGRIEVTCDKTGALVNYGVVKTAAAGGNDTTGAPSTSLATARTTPYATVAEAINDNATVVILTDDDTASHAWTQSPVKSQAYCIEVRPDPADVAGNITLTLAISTSSVRCKHLMLAGGFNVDIGTGSYYFDGDANTYESTFIANGVNWTSASTIADVLDFRMANFVDVLTTSYKWTRFGTIQSAWNAMGCRLSGTGNRGMECFGAIVACSMGTGFAPLLGEGSAGNNAQHIARNISIDFNRFDRWTPATALQFITFDDAIDGDVSMRGNVIVNSGSAEGDNFVGNDVTFDNFLFRHNTIQGMPFACFYDTSTPADSRTNLFIDGNALYRISTKTDIFAPADGSRTGNWWIVFGTGIANTRVDGSVSFLPEWIGNNSGLVGTDGNYTEMGYTTDNSRVGAGGGGGNYLPTAGSVLRNAMQVSEALIAFDLFGTNIPSSGIMDIGAVLNTPPPDPGPGPNNLNTNSLSIGTLDFQ